MKGKQLLKQWQLEVAYASRETLAMKYWPEAKAIGADRLCVAYLTGGGAFGPSAFACYNGKGIYPEELHLVSTTAKPTVTCPPGQVAYQHPDGSWGCKPVTTPGFFLCPSGTHYSAPLKKCIPTKHQPPPKSFFGSSSAAPIKCPPGYHYDTLNRRCLPNFSLLAGAQPQQFAGEVKWIGAVGITLEQMPEPIGYYKTILIAWSKSIEAKSMVPKIPFDDYGTNPIDQTSDWKCSRDGRMLTAFSAWWGPKHPGKLTTAASDKVPGCEGMLTTLLSAEHRAALKEWSTGASFPLPCPTGQYWNSNTNKCEVVPFVVVVATPDPACLVGCENKFGVSQGADYNQAKLNECVANCKQPSGGGGQQQASGGQQPAPGSQKQDQPQKPQEPGSGTPAAPAAVKKSGSGWLIVGAIGVAIVGGLAVLAGRKTEMLALNPLHWDENSGARERLFLLSSVGPTSIKQFNWKYNPSRDHWTGGWPSGAHRVTREGSASLEKLQRVFGISRREAMQMIGMPE